MCDDFFDGFDDIICLLFGDILADRKSERAVRYVVYPSYRKQHMARVKRPGGTRRTAGAANALGVEQQQQAFAFHTLKAQDVNFTKQRLIESIDYYKQAVNNEYQNVLNAYNEQIEDKIKNPKRQIDSLLERKAELMQQLVELDDKVKSIEAEIAQNSAELSSKRADYEVTFSVVLNKLETEKQQLNSILQ